MSDHFPPIKMDIPHHCLKCGVIAMHECTIYTDTEYRVCKRCHHRSTWVPEGKVLKKTAEVTPDKLKKEDDNKRRFPHRRNKTKKTEDEDDQDD